MGSLPNVLSVPKKIAAERLLTTRADYALTIVCRVAVAVNLRSAHPFAEQFQFET